MFRRRPPLIGAATRLHSYCIDRRIGVELRQIAGVSRTQPRVWVPTSNYNTEGRPADMLRTHSRYVVPPVSNCAAATNSSESSRKPGSGGLGRLRVRRPSISASSAAGLPRRQYKVPHAL